jgi:hypothetical protein
VGIEIGQRQGDALIPAGRTQLACRNNYPFLFLNRIITLLLRFRSNLIRFLISRDIVFRFGLQAISIIIGGNFGSGSTSSAASSVVVLCRRGQSREFYRNLSGGKTEE